MIAFFGTQHYRNRELDWVSARDGSAWVNTIGWGKNGAWDGRFDV
jgi:hypothetical protein